MPVRQLIVLVALFGTCLAIIGIAWATGSELFLYLPGRHFSSHRPPTHPGGVLGLLVISVLLTCWFRQGGVYFFILMAVGILLGSAVGFFGFGWTPSWAQHLLTAAMIGTSIYAWQQRDYFEE